MKKLIFGFILISLFSCKEDLQMMQPVNSSNQTLITPTTTQSKKGMVVDSIWFAKTFPGYKKACIRWYGYGDFNKDGLKDIVSVFASNGTQDYNYQDDLSKRIVVGVFVSKKTYFELDTNLVYSQLGGWNGANVSDVDSDGDLDIYHMTGGWEGSSHPRPSYYVGNGNGAMDSFLFLNQNNKSFKKVVLPIGEAAGVCSSILFDRNNDGYSEIYLSNGDYYDFNGSSVIQKKFNIINTFNGVKYDLRVISPKYGNSKYGLIYLASDNFTDTYFILKAVGNDLIPIVKYDVPFTKSGFSDATNGERDELYIEDLDKDGNVEYIIPSQLFNTDTTPCIPYLLIVDKNGNVVTDKFLDSSINNPLKYTQFNGGLWNLTGYIYYTFSDIDGDGIKEIFAASGLGYLENGNTYYFKLTDGKYRKVLYHSGWFGEMNSNTNRVQYWPFVDEKNNIAVFHIDERSIDGIIVKTN